MRPDLSVVIPAYNEAARLEPTVREAVEFFRGRSQSVEVLVVDDGSRDGTSELVNRLAVEFDEVVLIRQAENRGKGCAVRTGVLNSRGQMVLFADADGSTPIAEVDRLVAAIEQGAGVAIGSRSMHGEGVHVSAKIHRRIIGRVFHLLTSFLTVRGFKDTQCGFKLLRASVAHDLFSRMRMNGFSFDVEMLVMARRGGITVTEIPVTWTHKSGSRVSLIRDGLRMASDLFVIRARMLRGDYEQRRVALIDLGAQNRDAESVVAKESATYGLSLRPRASLQDTTASPGATSAAI